MENFEKEKEKGVHHSTMVICWPTYTSPRYFFSDYREKFDGFNEDY